MPILRHWRDPSPVPLLWRFRKAPGLHKVQPFGASAFRKQEALLTKESPMRLTRSLCGLGFVLALAAPSAWGQDAPAYSPFPSLSSPYCPRDQAGQPAGVPATALPTGVTANGQPAPAPDGSAPAMNVNGGLDSASGMGGGLASGGGGGMPGMIGDFLGAYYLRTVPVVIYNTATGDRDPAIALSGLPILSRGPYKIADNESPEPQDRVFLNYNYFKIRGNYPDIAPFVEGIDLHRLTVGFEKTFWNGHASVGLRAPFFSSNYNGRTLIQPNADNGFDVAVPLVDELEDSELGDITLIFKASMGCCVQHKLCTFGLAVTIPTGPSIEAFDLSTYNFQDKHSGILQPFVGYLWTGNNWYVHGFFSVAFPTHTGDDVITLFSDIGFGYYLYGSVPGLHGCGGAGCGSNGCYGGCAGAGDCCGMGCWGDCSMLGGLMPTWLTSIVPTVEFHLNTPLTNGGKFDYFQDSPGSISYVVSTDQNVLMSQSLIMTGGVHFGIMNSSTLTVGAAVPLNVQPFDVEGIVQLNVRF